MTFKNQLWVVFISLFFFVHPSWAEKPLWHEGDPHLQEAAQNDQSLQFGTFARLAEALSPAVVSIQIQGVVRRPAPMGPFPFGPFPQMGPNIIRGQGSGFFINEDGYLLTNAHVVQDADEITVQLLDGRQFNGQVLGIDEKTDLALLKVDGKGPFPYVHLGSSKDLKVGEWVLAIGNPMGLDHTVTLGIVSAKGRRNLRPDGKDLYENFIQTDASINPGNSGGPLFNIRGEVIGINAAINPNGQNIGFAIPIDMAKTLIPMLKKGRVERSWIGIMIQPMTKDLARSYGLDDPKGALVSKVVPGGPAEEAGIQPGDIIVEFDGHQIDSHDDLPWLASTAGVGRTVEVKILRNGKPKTIKVTLGLMPGSGQAFQGKGGAAQMGDLGLDLQTVTPKLARRYNLAVDHGVLIVNIDPRSPLRSAMIREGDVILQVGSQSIESVNDFETAIQRYQSGEMVRMLVVRGDFQLYIAFSMP